MSSQTQPQAPKQPAPSRQVKRLVLMALFIGLSLIGATIKLPSPTGTIALDSAPGYLGAVLLGWKEGALIIALGHLLSSYLVGMPLSVPIHLLNAVMMALAAGIFGFLFHRVSALVAIVVATIVNGVIMLLPLVPIMGMPFFYSMVMPLTVASLVNVVLAAFLYRILKNVNLD